MKNVFNKSLLIFLLILVFAFFWRFINFENRWTLSQDQARDAIIGEFILEKGIIPLIGPPSSVGTFSFGPYYYYLIAIFNLLLPGVNGLWIGFSLFSIGSVIIFYLIGKSLGSERLAIILGIISAFSSAAVFHSVDLLNPMLVLFFSTLTIFLFIRLVETKNNWYGLLLGLSIGFSVNFHIQSLMLLIFFIAIFLIKNINLKAKSLIFLLGIFGSFLTFIPLFIFNLQSKGQVFKNIFSYLVSSPDSTGSNIFIIFVKDLLIVWPKLVGETITFIPNLGYLILPILVISLIYFFTIKKENTQESIKLITISLIIQVILLSLHAGARLPVYLLVFHPFIIFLTGFVIWRWWEVKKQVGILFFVILIAICTYSNINIIKGLTQKPLIYEIKNQIDIKEGREIDLYSIEESNMISLPLFYLYLYEKRIKEDGAKIGVCEGKFTSGKIRNCPSDPTPMLIKNNFYIYDLENLSGDKIRELKFERMSAEKIYDWIYSLY